MAEDLVPVQDGMMLLARTAARWADLKAEVSRRHRVTLRLTSPAGAWRSPEMVQDMWLSSPARRREVYGVPIGTGVAKPRSLGGGGSVHENGRCIDIGNWSLVGSKNLVPLASSFGFVQTIATEAWHFEDRLGGGSGGGGVSPAPPIPEEDVMKDLYNESLGNIVYGPGVVVRLSQNRWNELQLVRGNFTSGTNAPNASLVVPGQFLPSFLLGGSGYPLLRPLEVDVPWYAPGGGTVTAAPFDPQVVADAARAGAAEAVAAIKFPTTLTIDPPAATGTLS